MSDSSSHTSSNNPRVGIVVPPPLPEAALATAPQAIAPLLRIPGMVEETYPRRFQVGDKEYTITDIIALTRGSNTRMHIIAIKILGALEGLNRSELHLACSALYAIGHDSLSTSAELARDSLTQLLIAHGTNCEAIYIGTQIVRSWSPLTACEASNAVLIGWLNSTLKTLRFDPTANRKQCVERRYCLLKAFEVEQLRASTCEGMRAILSDRCSDFAAERKELAGNILAYLRLHSLSSPHINEVKRLALPALTSGLVSDLTPKTKAVDIDRATICTTALEAELRRQFGLACSIEMSKALKLLGRVLRIEEYERAISFSTTSPHSDPRNRSWFSKDEWNTASRLLQLAKGDTEILPEIVAALIYVLATRVKAEDHSDPRDSRRRVDVIGAEERNILLTDVQKLCNHKAISMASVTALAEQIVERALPAPFNTWRYEQHVEPKRSEQENPIRSLKDRTARTSKVIAKLLQDENPSTVLRMVPEELHLLRQVENLSVEEFKVITQRLQSRAVNDLWARTTILDLVRLPHAPGVTARVRTAALGALISEARRMGKLSIDLEKEVFAVSAEIPSLPFLNSSAEQEDDLPLYDQDDDF